jgi:hypothetical protein
MGQDGQPEIFTSLHFSLCGPDLSSMQCKTGTLREHHKSGIPAHSAITDVQEFQGEDGLCYIRFSIFGDDL